LFGVSNADALCLTVLLCVDLSVVGWLQNPRLQQDCQPVTNGTLAATGQDPDSTQFSAVPSSTTPDAETTTPDADKPDDRLWQHAYGSYIVKTVSGSVEQDDFILQVFKAGELVFSTNSYLFYDPEAPATDDSGDIPRPFTNITGNGIPDLIVIDYSGGAHCCMSYYIFELGDEFRLIGTIPAEHGTVDFKDIDGDGIPEIKMSDWSYAYVFGCFASSPAPDVILRYTNGRYEIAPDLMQTPAPDAAELRQMADEIKTNCAQMVEAGELSSEWAADSGLWQHMLDLIYAGHEDEARRLFDMAWPKEAEGKDEALTNFVEAVTNSTYWEAMYGVENATTDTVESVASPTTEASPSGRQ